MIDNPDSVRRVIAPKRAMINIMAQQTKSQHVTGRGFDFLSIGPALPYKRGVFHHRMVRFILDIDLIWH